MSKWVGGCTQASAHVPALWKPPPEHSAAGNSYLAVSPAISTEPPTPFTNALHTSGPAGTDRGATTHGDNQPSQAKNVAHHSLLSQHPSPYSHGLAEICSDPIARLTGPTSSDMPACILKVRAHLQLAPVA